LRGLEIGLEKGLEKGLGGLGRPRKFQRYWGCVAR